MSIEKQYVLLGTEKIEVIVSSATTNGAYSILTELAPPQYGPAPHIHTLEDEFVMPLFGEFERFDGSSWSPMPAEGFYTPRGTVHTWRNSGTKPAKLFVMNTGSSFDKFMERLIGLETPRDLQKILDVGAEHGITFVLPQNHDQATAQS